MTTERPEGREEGHGAEFTERANEARPVLLVELWEFLATSKKWWLTPIVLVVLLVGALIVFSGTGAAPFIYALF